MKRISFDFDNTLQNPALQTLAKGFIEDGHEVFIITSRLSDERRQTSKNDDLFNVAKQVGIGIENIIFTEGESKRWDIFRRDINIHFEDCPTECEQLRPFCTVIQVEPFIIEEE